MNNMSTYEIISKKMLEYNFEDNVLDEYERSEREDYIPSCISLEFKVYTIKTLMKFSTLYENHDIQYTIKDCLIEICTLFVSKLNFYQFMQKYCEEDDIFIKDCLKYIYNIIDITPSSDEIIYANITGKISFEDIDIYRLREALHDKSEETQKKLVSFYLSHLGVFLYDENNTNDGIKIDELIELFQFIKEYLNIFAHTNNVITLFDSTFVIEGGLIVVY